MSHLSTEATARALAAFEALGTEATGPAWRAGLGVSITRILRDAGDEGQALVQRWLDRSRFPPRPAELLEVLAEIRAERSPGGPARPEACAACTEGARRVVQLWRRRGRLVEEASMCACSCLAGEVWARSLAEQRPNRRPVRVRTLRDLEEELLHVPAVRVEDGEDGWIAWWVAPSRFATPAWALRAQAELKAQMGRPGRATEAAIAAALATVGRKQEAPRGRVPLSMPPSVEQTIRDADRSWNEQEGEWAAK